MLTQQKPSAFMSLIYFLSGSNYEPLMACNANDRASRIRLGWTVLIVVFVSSIVAGRAWSIPLGPAGWLVAPLWFAVMAGLEGLILQQMDNSAVNAVMSIWQKGQPVTPLTKVRTGGWFLILRLLMIFGVSYFNSEMIRIVMFEPEIVAEIKLRVDGQLNQIHGSFEIKRDSVEAVYTVADNVVKAREADLATLIAGLDASIKADRDSAAYYTSILPHEVKGPAGLTGRTGDGPVAKSIRETIVTLDKRVSQGIRDRDYARDSSAQALAVRSAIQDRNDARKTADKALAVVDAKEAEFRQQVIDRPVNGLSFMLTVLNDIAKRNWLIWAVFFLFFFVEGIPVIMKYMSAKVDSYILVLATQRMRELRAANDEASNLVIPNQ